MPSSHGDTARPPLSRAALQRQFHDMFDWRARPRGPALHAVTIAGLGVLLCLVLGSVVASSKFADPENAATGAPPLVAESSQVLNGPEDASAACDRGSGCPGA